MAVIKVYQCDSCTGWHLDINERCVFVAGTQGMAERMAKRLSDARNSSGREAMRILREDIGFEEEAAKNVLFELKGGGNTPTDKKHMH